LFVARQAYTSKEKREKNEIKKKETDEQTSVVIARGRQTNLAY